MEKDVLSQLIAEWCKFLLVGQKNKTDDYVKIDGWIGIILVPVDTLQLKFSAFHRYPDGSNQTTSSLPVVSGTFHKVFPFFSGSSTNSF